MPVVAGSRQESTGDPLVQEGHRSLAAPAAAEWGESVRPGSPADGALAADYVMLKRGVRVKPADLDLERALQLAVDLPAKSDNTHSIFTGLTSLQPHCTPGDMWLLSECGRWQSHPGGWEGPARGLLQVVQARANAAGAFEYRLHELDPAGAPTGRVFNSGRQMQILTDRVNWANWRSSFYVVLGPLTRVGLKIFQKRVMPGGRLYGKRPVRFEIHGAGSSEPGTAQGSSASASSASKQLSEQFTLEAALQLVRDVITANEQPAAAAADATAATEAAPGLADAAAGLQQHRQSGDIWLAVTCGTWDRTPSPWQGQPAQVLLQLWQVDENAYNYQLYELNPAGIPTDEVMTTGNQFLQRTNRAGWNKWKESVLVLFGTHPSEVMRVDTFMRKALPGAELIQKVAKLFIYRQQPITAAAASSASQVVAAAGAAASAQRMPDK